MKMANANDGVVRSMMAVLANQTNYIDQLKKENSVLVQELDAFKQRLTAVVDENQNIYDDMQLKVLSQTLDCSHALLKSQLTFASPKTVQPPNECPPVPPLVPQPTISSTNSEKRDKEHEEKINEIKSLYESKLAALEAQVHTTKGSLRNALSENDQLKLQLSVASSANMMKPTKKENMNTTQVNLPLIERLTKERDDLMRSLAAVRTSLSQSQAEQAELRREVQKSLATVEDIQLEKTQFMIDRERLKDAFREVNQKLHQEIGDGHKRVLDASVKQRSLCVGEINDLQRKVGELMASCSRLETGLEKCSKEKTAALLQLEESRSQLLQCEKDMATMKAEIDHEIKSTLKGYSGAEVELRDTKVKLEQELLKTKQERARHEQESTELQLRLKEAEIHGLKTLELNVVLTEQLQKTEAKKDKLNDEILKLRKTFTTLSEEQSKSSEKKVEELTNALQSVQIEYEKRLSDLEEISQKQSKLISRLRSECQSLGDSLQNLANKHRIEVGKLTHKLEQAKVRVARLDKQNKELSKQCVQHGFTHRQMQERLCEVDNRARVSTNQVLELLDRHSQDEKVNELLKKEVQFLHSFLMEDKHTF